MQFKDTPINHHVRRSILCKDKSQFVIDKETARKIKYHANQKERCI